MVRGGLAIGLSLGGGIGSVFGWAWALLIGSGSLIFALAFYAVESVKEDW